MMSEVMMLAMAPLVAGWTPGASVARSARVTMKLDEGRYMYGEPLAPAGMGREYINDPTARRPLSEYVGASEELNLVAYFKGEGEALEPWDPLDLCLLSKVSANNPDVAFLREAELKHGRIAMLAFVGIAITSGGGHLPAAAFEKATAAGCGNDWHYRGRKQHAARSLVGWTLVWRARGLEGGGRRLGIRPVATDANR